MPCSRGCHCPDGNRPNESHHPLDGDWDESTGFLPQGFFFSLVAGGNLAAAGGKAVGLVLIVPSMVFTLLINTLQVINPIWGKWPPQNPPQVSYVRLRAGRAACTHSLLPTTRKPIRRGM